MNLQSPNRNPFITLGGISSRKCWWDDTIRKDVNTPTIDVHPAALKRDMSMPIGNVITNNRSLSAGKYNDKKLEAIAQNQQLKKTVERLLLGTTEREYRQYPEKYILPRYTSPQLVQLQEQHRLISELSNQIQLNQQKIMQYQTVYESIHAKLAQVYAIEHQIQSKIKQRFKTERQYQKQSQ